MSQGKTRPGVDEGRLRSLHARGMRDREIGRRMRLEAIVVRAQRGRLGLASNKGDAPIGAYDRNSLAFRLALALKSGENIDALAKELGDVFLRFARQPRDRQHDADLHRVVDEE